MELKDLTCYDFRTKYIDDPLEISQPLQARTVSGAIREVLKVEASPFLGSGELKAISSITVEGMELWRMYEGF